MSAQPGSEKLIGEPRPPSSTLRNLAFVVLVAAGLGVAGQGWATEKEIYRNLGGGVAAWLVCSLLLILGLAIMWLALVQFTPRVTGRSRAGSLWQAKLWAMFFLVIFAGAVGGSAGRSLDWRLKWTADHYLEGRAEDWPEVQGWIGWALAVSVVVSVWSIAAQVLSDRRKIEG